MKLRIDRSIGDWKNEAVYRLEIKKGDEANASISLFSPFGPPISHPYWDGKVTVPMPVTYNDHIGDLEM